jgi:hypothetical protein
MVIVTLIHKALQATKPNHVIRSRILLTRNPLRRITITVYPPPYELSGAPNPLFREIVLGTAVSLLVEIG